MLEELHGANIRPLMVTGDNILTAIRQVFGILEPWSLTLEPFMFTLGLWRLTLDPHWFLF